MFFQDKSPASLYGPRAHQTLGDEGRRPHPPLGRDGSWDFAPVVDEPRVQVLGAASYPEPSRMGAEEVYLGRPTVNGWNSKNRSRQSIGRAQCERHCRRRTSSVSSESAGGFRRRHPVRLDRRPHPRAGACGTRFNARRQLLGVQLLVPGLDQFTVLEPAGVAPFDRPIRPIQSLLQFSPSESSGRSITCAARWKPRIRGAHVDSRRFRRRGDRGPSADRADAGRSRGGGRIRRAGAFSPVIASAAIRKGVETGPAPPVPL